MDMPMDVNAVVIYLAIVLAGYVVGSIEDSFAPSEIVTRLRISKGKAIFTRANVLLLSEGMVFKFYKAQGHSVGSSLVEEDRLDLAKCYVEQAIPSDAVIVDKFSADAKWKIVPASGIPDGWIGLDIGPGSVKAFGEALDATETVIWNGPMCVFQFDKFAAGTEKLADLSGKGMMTIIGGGDFVAAVEKVGLEEKSHL